MAFVQFERLPMEAFFMRRAPYGFRTFIIFPLQVLLGNCCIDHSQRQHYEAQTDFAVHRRSLWFQLSQYAQTKIALNWVDRLRLIKSLLSAEKSLCQSRHKVRSLFLWVCFWSIYETTFTKGITNYVLSLVSTCSSSFNFQARNLIRNLLLFSSVLCLLFVALYNEF